jgi:hypothetical protein
MFVIRHEVDLEIIAGGFPGIAIWLEMTRETGG